MRAGDWLVLAGQVGLDPATGRMVDGGVEAQARQVLANITAVLARLRRRRSPTSRRRPCSSPTSPSSPTVNAVYAEAFGDHRPARSTVQVAALPGGAEVEIEVWAYVPVPA